MCKLTVNKYKEDLWTVLWCTTTANSLVYALLDDEIANQLIVEHNDGRGSYKRFRGRKKKIRRTPVYQRERSAAV